MNHLSSGDESKWEEMKKIVIHYPAVWQTNLTKEFYILHYARLFLANIFSFLMQYSGLLLATLVPAPLPVSFSAGMSCALVFLRGKGVVPGILLGGIAAYLSVGADLKLAFLCSALATFQSVMIPECCYRYVGPSVIFHHQKEGGRFLLCVITVVAMVSFCTSWLINNLFGSMPTFVGMRGLKMMLADINSLFVITLPMMTLDAYFPSLSFLKKKQLMYPALLLGVLSLVTLLIGGLGTPLLIVCCMIVSLVLSALCASLGWCTGLFAIFLSGILLSLEALIHTVSFSMSLLIQGYLLCLIMVVLPIVISGQNNRYKQEESNFSSY
ncbi:MAG: hypothetical protein HY939_00160 [Gammaproteobacteria bacterium]|nr:hypothetical protein [Gammaproteobacteria bacterium]